MTSENTGLEKVGKTINFHFWLMHGTDDDLCNLKPKPKQKPMDFRERRESGSQI